MSGLGLEMAFASAMLWSVPAPTRGHKSSDVSWRVAPRLRRMFFVSSLTFSGITISTLYPSAAAIPVSAIPVLPDEGSIIMLLSFFKIPFLSACFIIQYAARSFTEPKGLYHSSLAYSFTFLVENDLSSISGVCPICSTTSGLANAVNFFISPSLLRIQDLYHFYLTISADVRCD